MLSARLVFVRELIFINRYLSLARWCRTHCRGPCVSNHWYSLSSVHSWWPCCDAELIKQYYSASVTVYTVRIAVRTQMYLLTYLFTCLQDCFGVACCYASENHILFSTRLLVFVTKATEVFFSKLVCRVRCWEKRVIFSATSGSCDVAVKEVHKRIALANDTSQKVFISLSSFIWLSTS